MSAPTGTLDVVVERDRCCGYGNCVLVAPTVFSLDDDDGIVRELDAQPDASLRAEVTEAVAGCPTEAIKLRN